MIDGGIRYHWSRRRRSPPDEGRRSYAFLVHPGRHGALSTPNIDSETLLAIPFFLLVGELTVVAERGLSHDRPRRRSEHLGGSPRSSPCFSMSSLGHFGSPLATSGAEARTVAPEMDKERYDRAFTAALIASASTMANLIPTVDHGGGLWRHRQCVDRRFVLGRCGAGRDDRCGPDDLQLFLRPTGTMKKRAGLVDIFVAARGSALRW